MPRADDSQQRQLTIAIGFTDINIIVVSQSKESQILDLRVNVIQ